MPSLLLFEWCQSFWGTGKGFEGMQNVKGVEEACFFKLQYGHCHGSPRSASSQSHPENRMNDTIVTQGQ